jgi:tetratricopeptide (TPR) repeat protein
VRARALHAAGRLAYVHADRGAERAFFEQAVELFRRAGDTPGEVITEVDMAWTALAVGHVEKAHAMAESCVARARALDDRYVYAWALRLLGETLIALERFGDSERAFRESLAVFEECRDPREETRGLSCLAWLAIVKGDYESAARLLGDSIARISATDAEVLAIDLNNLGLVNILLGNDAQALGVLSESLQHSVPLGSRLLVAEALLGLAVIAARASDRLRAAQLRAASQALHLACESPLNPPEERLEQFLLDDLGPAEPWSGDIDLDNASALATEVVTRLEALQPAS